MTNDIKALIDYYEREKGLSREKILLALESAFLSAYRKMVPGSGSINYLRAEINVDKGKVRIFADLEVVPDEEYSDKFNQIPLSLAVKLDRNAVLHDLLPTNITPKGFWPHRGTDCPPDHAPEAAGCGKGNALRRVQGPRRRSGDGHHPPL